MGPRCISNIKIYSYNYKTLIVNEYVLRGLSLKVIWFCIHAVWIKYLQQGITHINIGSILKYNYGITDKHKEI